VAAPGRSALFPTLPGRYRRREGAGRRV